MREFILYIDEAACGVYQKGYDVWAGNDYDDKRNDNYIFATYCVKDEKFMGFYSSCIFDKHIEAAKKDKLMQEICKFEVLICNKPKETFNGTFVDALKYIKENFKV